MIASLAAIAARTRDEHGYLADKDAQRLEDQLARLESDTPAIFKLELHYKLGEAELRQGREREAIEHLTTAHELISNAREDLAPGWASKITFRLAVAYMRLAESLNCDQRHSPQSCTLPTPPNGVHTIEDPSNSAVKYLNEVLARARPGSPPHLASVWLLNIAHMNLGSYPDGVRSEYLIPPAAFDSDERFPRFEDISHQLGLDTFGLSGSVVAEDFDNDGDLDLLVSDYRPNGRLCFYRNVGAKKFSDSTETANLRGITGGLNMVQGDYDNDGDADVLVLRGAWLGKSGRHPNSLLRNNGDGTFTDVTFDTGLGDVHYPTQTAAWADYDHDGDLDIYIGNETTPSQHSPSQLFNNNGDGTFTDVAAAAGVENLRFAKAVSWGDYDSELGPDLYVSNLGENNRLYHNNGDGTFTDVAKRLGVDEPHESFPAWFWDFDNDGNLDLFVSAYEANIADIAASYLGMTTKVEMARLYRGNGRGGFEDVTQSVQMNRPTAPMGSNYGDIDNDGYLDFYLGTGYPDYRELMPNVMLRNRNGRSFADVTASGGFGNLQKGHGVAFADLDGDCDQDLFEQRGGAFAGDGARDALYENPGFGHHWINVMVVGVESNRSGIGARLRIDVTQEGRSRAIYKHVNSGGSFGANPLRQTIGLGDADEIQSLAVHWPGSNRVQTFLDVPMECDVVVVEKRAELIVLGSPQGHERRPD